MNVKEKALSESIKEYSNSVTRYYTTLEGRRIKR